MWQMTLKWKHLIKFNKAILHSLCGNKTLKAIDRNTKATHGLQAIIKSFDAQCKIKPDSTALTHMSKMEDEKIMVKKLKEVRPFCYTAGRKSETFPNISKCLLNEVDPVSLDSWLEETQETAGRKPVR